MAVASSYINFAKYRPRRRGPKIQNMQRGANLFQNNIFNYVILILWESDFLWAKKPIFIEIKIKPRVSRADTCLWSAVRTPKSVKYNTGFSSHDVKLLGSYTKSYWRVQLRWDIFCFSNTVASLQCHSHAFNNRLVARCIIVLLGTAIYCFGVVMSTGRW